MKKDRTDLTAVVLDGPDKVQHLFWRFVDSGAGRQGVQRLAQAHSKVWRSASIAT